MSGVWASCLMQVIHIQGHIPYVTCTASLAISGNYELKKKTPLLTARITEKTLYNSQRSCGQGKRPSTKTCGGFLPALQMLAFVKPAGSQDRLGQHQGG